MAHTHTAPPPALVARPSIGGVLVRVVFTLAGAAGLVVGAFMQWVRDLEGTNLYWGALVRPTFREAGTLAETVGFVMVVLALVGMVGLAARTGWLTGLAGALGLVGAVLFGIQLYRDAGEEFSQLPEAGAWLALAGALVLVIASFFGARPRATAPDGSTV